MEIKCIKSAARLLKKDCVNKGGLDLSKKVLWVSVDQIRRRRSGFEPAWEAEFSFDLQL